MAIHNDFAVRQLFRANLLLIVCCACYLVWWLLAFRPAGPVKGIRSAWLLLPALASGLWGVILAAKGILSAPVGRGLFPPGRLLWGGIAAYLLLLAVTRLFFHRPATTELFLIVGWAVLALSEIGALYSIGRFGSSTALVFTAVAGAAAAVSLVCYVLYYRLGTQAAYVDGMVPLLAAALVMAGLCAAMAF